MNSWIDLFLSIIAGAAFGTSCGLGFWPRYRQPDNLIIQISIAVIGIAAITILLIRIS